MKKLSTHNWVWFEKDFSQIGSISGLTMICDELHTVVGLFQVNTSLTISTHYYQQPQNGSKSEPLGQTTQRQAERNGVDGLQLVTAQLLAQVRQVGSALG